MKSIINLIERYYHLIISFIVLIFIIAVFLLTPNKGMSPVYSTPYFSGAVSLDVSKGWQFNPNEVDELKKTTGYEMYTYHFNKAKPSTSINNLNNTGFLYVVAFTNFIFPFLGPIGAITLFQIIIHCIISYLIYGLLKRKEEKLIFLLLYFANPLIIYITIFPFYYFWQVVPSVVFLYFYLDKNKKILIRSFVFGILLSLLTFFIRPTVLFLIPGIIFFCAWKYKSWIPILSIPVLLGLSILWNNTLNMTKGYGPWHTAYIGLGAYPNSISGLYDLSDDRGYDRYETLTGTRISASIDGSFTKNADIRIKYLETLKKEYLNVLKKQPFMVIRNAALNYFQGFALGYVNKGPFFLHLIMAFIGFMFFLFLLIKKYWIELLAISLSHMSFTFFYPPIQMYYFGTIILLVVFAIKTVIIPFLDKNATKNRVEA